MRTSLKETSVGKMVFSGGDLELKTGSQIDSRTNRTPQKSQSKPREQSYLYNCHCFVKKITTITCRVYRRITEYLALPE